MPPLARSRTAPRTESAGPAALAAEKIAAQDAIVSGFEAVAATGAPMAIAIPTTTASTFEPSAAGARPAPSNATPATPDRTAIVARALE